MKRASAFFGLLILALSPAVPAAASTGDLVAVSVYWSDAAGASKMTSLEEGGTYYLHGSFSYTNLDQVYSWRLGWFLDDVLLKVTAASNRVGGVHQTNGSQSVTLTSFPLTALSGLHVLKLVVDPLLDVPETNEGNNTNKLQYFLPAGFGPWSGATDLGGGWKWLGWFGYFYDAGDGWIYHNEHGWMYAQASMPANIWLWSASLGWTYTGLSTYPYLFRYHSTGGGDWLWYQRDTAAPRWFYNFTTGLWEQR